MPLLERRIHMENRFASDEEFNELYPLTSQKLASRHYTPLHVAKKAAKFLAAENNARILDIGSGAGKFCLAAAYYKPKAFYYGIEQRLGLFNHAETAKNILGFENIKFMHGNFTQLDFKNYDHFYFFNSFYENLEGTNKIDNSIDYSGELYNYYNRYLYKQLDLKPRGTRLATYHSLENEVPRSYQVVGSDFESLLRYWIKI